MKLFAPVREPDPPLDPRFEPFRACLAEATLDGVAVGFLSIRIQSWFTITGPWWRRRWTNPRWGVEWLLELTEPHNGIHHRVGPPYEDGVSLSSSVIDELIADTFDLRGDVYSLSWIDRDESPRKWAEHYAYLQ